MRDAFRARPVQFAGRHRENRNPGGRGMSAATVGDPRKQTTLKPRGRASTSLPGEHRQNWLSRMRPCGTGAATSSGRRKVDCPASGTKKNRPAVRWPGGIKRGCGGCLRFSLALRHVKTEEVHGRRTEPSSRLGNAPATVLLLCWCLACGACAPACGACAPHLTPLVASYASVPTPLVASYASHPTPLGARSASLLPPFRAICASLLPPFRAICASLLPPVCAI